MTKPCNARSTKGIVFGTGAPPTSPPPPKHASIDPVTQPGSWINGVNVANTLAFSVDGKCSTCGQPVTGAETFVSAAARPHGSAGRVPPPKFEGPYYVPCGHDAADVFGGRQQ